MKNQAAVARRTQRDPTLRRLLRLAMTESQGEERRVAFQNVTVYLLSFNPRGR